MQANASSLFAWPPNDDHDVAPGSTELSDATVQFEVAGSLSSEYAPPQLGEQAFFGSATTNASAMSRAGLRAGFWNW